jgi:acetylornithine/succinyldiaminopimelate/putrescine aminotransferase
VAALSALRGSDRELYRGRAYFQGSKRGNSPSSRVRGRGLILGMELKIEGGAIVKEMMQRGILINCTMGNVLRFLPPLIDQERNRPDVEGNGRSV